MTPGRSISQCVGRLQRSPMLRLARPPSSACIVSARKFHVKSTLVLESCIAPQFFPQSITSAHLPGSLRACVNGRASYRLFYSATVRGLPNKDKLPSELSNLATPDPAPLPTTPLKDRIKSFTPYENIYTVPNVLTFSRIAAAPLIGYLVIHDSHAWALGLFAYAGITDLVDGWIARRWKLQTVVGSVVDPMADKMLMTILTVCLAVKGAMPVWCATLILGRDILLAISAIYYRYISLPPPKTFTRYWDFSLPSAEVHPTTISKVNTVLQLVLIGWTVSTPMLTAWGLNSPELASALVGMQYLVGTTTVWSGWSYIYNKDAVKILSPAEQGQRQAENKTTSKAPSSTDPHNK